MTMQEPPECFRFRVTGRVQGVGFRDFVRRTATRLQLVGEVWNCRTGEVEGYVQGPAISLKAFLVDLRTGPGRPDGVTAEPAQECPIPKTFSIGRTR